MKSVTSILALLLAAHCTSTAQPCDCTLAQVRTNTVAACNRTIGEVVAVSSASAFRSAINHANTVGGNVTILIADGIYRVASSSSFPYLTASNVVIRSASGNRDAVVLEGEGMKDVTPSTENALLIAGDNVTVADLTIRNVGNHGIQVSGHHLFVHNVRIENTYQQMLKGASVAASIDSGIVQCSVFEYPSGRAPFYYTGGLDIHKGRGWLVRDNMFVGIQSPANSVAEHAVHFWNGSADNVVERNLILNCDRGIGFGLGSSANTGGVIRNNFIYNGGAAPFDDVGIGLESSPGTRVYNNTVIVSYSNAIEYRFAETRGVEILNNLTNRPIRSRDDAAATVASNISTAQQSWFVDADGGDLHIASNSVAPVDSGTDLTTYVPDDIDRAARPAGSAFDIGADELALPSSVDDDVSSTSEQPDLTQR